MNEEALKNTIEFEEIIERTDILPGSKAFLLKDLEDKFNQDKELSENEIDENRSQLFYHLRLKCIKDSIRELSKTLLNRLEQEIDYMASWKLDEVSFQRLKENLEKEKQIDKHIRQSLWWFWPAKEIWENQDRKDIEINKEFEDAFVEAYRKVHDETFDDSIYTNLRWKEWILASGEILEKVIYLIFEKLWKQNVEELLWIDSKNYNRDKKRDIKVDINTTSWNIYRVNLNYYYEKIFLKKDEDQKYLNVIDPFIEELKLFFEPSLLQSKKYKDIIRLLESNNEFNLVLGNLIDKYIFTDDYSTLIPNEKIDEIKKVIKSNIIVLLWFIISTESDFENIINHNSSAKWYLQFLNWINWWISNISKFNSSLINNPYEFKSDKPLPFSFLTAINRSLWNWNILSWNNFIWNINDIRTSYIDFDIYPDPRDLNWNDQCLLLLWDLFWRNQSVIDLLKETLLFWDSESLVKIYTEIHHTDIDEATKNRIYWSLIPPQIWKINIYKKYLTESISKKDELLWLKNSLINWNYSEKYLWNLLVALWYPRSFQLWIYSSNSDIIEYAIKEFQEDYLIEESQEWDLTKTKIKLAELLEELINNADREDKIDELNSIIIWKEWILEKTNRIKENLEVLWNDSIQIISGQPIVNFLQRSLVFLWFYWKNSDWKTLRDYPTNTNLWQITQNAIKEFQENNSIYATWELDRKTRRKISDLVSEKINNSTLNWINYKSSINLAYKELFPISTS